MKIIFLIATAFAIVGCGSSSKTYDVVENNITIDEPYPIPGGAAVIVDGSTDTTVTQDNQQIVIDCGGSCGDITIGIPVNN